MARDMISLEQVFAAFDALERNLAGTEKTVEQCKAAIADLSRTHEDAILACMKVSPILYEACRMLYQMNSLNKARNQRLEALEALVLAQAPTSSTEKALVDRVQAAITTRTARR